MPKPDRRIQRTQQLLGDALIQLAIEKSYETITIRDITEQANVAYVTFFRHYDSKDSLLLQRLDETIAELEQLARATYEQEAGNFHEVEGKLLFEHVAKNEAFYRMILGASIYTQVKERLAANILQHIKHHIAPDAFIAAELVAYHIAAALISLIEWWLKNAMIYPPEKMAQIYYVWVIAPTLVNHK